MSFKVEDLVCQVVQHCADAHGVVVYFAGGGVFHNNVSV